MRSDWGPIEGTSIIRLPTGRCVDSAIYRNALQEAGVGTELPMLPENLQLHLRAMQLAFVPDPEEE